MFQGWAKEGLRTPASQSALCYEIPVTFCDCHPCAGSLVDRRYYTFLVADIRRLLAGGTPGSIRAPVFRVVFELKGIAGSWITVDHVTVYRWVQPFSPPLIDAA